jgi:hypothetical protein
MARDILTNYQKSKHYVSGEARRAKPDRSDTEDVWDILYKQTKELFSFLMTTEKSLLMDMDEFQEKLPLLMDIYEVAREKKLKTKRTYQTF